MDPTEKCPRLRFYTNYYCNCYGEVKLLQKIGQHFAPSILTMTQIKNGIWMVFEWKIMVDMIQFTVAGQVLLAVHILSQFAPKDILSSTSQHLALFCTGRRRSHLYKSGDLIEVWEIEGSADN